MFSARWLEATEARDIGLVNTIVDDDDLHAEALAYAARLTTLSRRGLAEMKRLARRGLDLPLAEALRLEQDAATRHHPRPGHGRRPGRIRGPPQTELCLVLVRTTPRADRHE